MDKKLLNKIRNRQPVEKDETESKPPKPEPDTKNKPKLCADCGKEFSVKNPNQKRCPECVKNVRKGKDYPEKKCDRCGEMYKPQKIDQRFCPNCKGKAKPDYITKEQFKERTKVCAVPDCQKEFTTTTENARYCPECREKYTNYQLTEMGATNAKSDNYKKVKVKCGNDTGNCPNNRVFETTYLQYRKGRKYCSSFCRDEMMRDKSKRGKAKPPNPPQAKAVQVAEIPYEPHLNQKDFHSAYHTRFRVICAGARFGKDRASINEMIRLFAAMLSEDRDDTLVPRVMGWIVAPTYKLARQNWLELKYFFPDAWVTNKNEAERQLTTIGDGLIEVKSADDPDSLVAVGLDVAVFTEFAKTKHQDEVFANIRARLSSPGRGLSGKGGMAIFNSTPKGINLFYEMYNWGQDPNMEEWKSWHYKTEDNPYIAKEEIDSMRRSMTERMFRQECLAEFLSDGGEVFPNVDAICTGIQQEPEMGMRYYAGWDPAHAGDFSAFAIRSERGELVYLVRWTGMPWTTQLDKIAYYCKRYNNAHLDIDRTGLGETLPEAAAQRGLSVEGHFFSNLFKEQMVNHFALLCEQKAVVLIDDQPLKEEMKAYTYTTTKTGKINYSHPAGGHDDLITAVMLAFRDYNSPTATTPYLGFLSGIAHKKAI